MRRILFILMSCFAFTVFVVPVQASTVWFPTKSGQIDVNTLNLGDFDVAIFDDDDTDFSTPLILDKPGDTIFFNQDNGDWVLTSSETPNTITLANSYHFVLALDDSGSWIGCTDFEKIAFGIYTVKWDLEKQITLIDAQPVPLPASILLFGTGLLGLSSFRRRK